MLDHITIKVSNLEKSTTFYEKALAPLGYKKFEGDFDGAVGFGVDNPEDDSGHLWMFDEGNLTKLTEAHIAFRAKNKAMVDAFYEVAIQVGGKDNGRPGLRPEYGDTYYGAFVLDPDGNNVEATCYVK